MHGEVRSACDFEAKFRGLKFKPDWACSFIYYLFFVSNVQFYARLGARVLDHSIPGRTSKMKAGETRSFGTIALPSRRWGSPQTNDGHLGRASGILMTNFDHLGIFRRATNSSVTRHPLRHNPPSDCGYLGQDSNVLPGDPRRRFASEPLRRLHPSVGDEECTDTFLF